MDCTLGRRRSRHALAKDREWLLECLAHRGEPSWVEKQWAGLQGPGTPDWKRVAIARAGKALGLALQLSPGAFRVYVGKRHHGEPRSTWAALAILARLGVLPPAGTKWPVPF